MGDCWQVVGELGECCNELRWSVVVLLTSELDGEFVSFRADNFCNIVESVCGESSSIITIPEEDSDNN